MKLPRWLLIGMIGSSLLMPIVAAVCCWTLLPKLTADRFAESLADGDLKTVYELMPDGKWFISQSGFEPNLSGRESAIVQERSFTDLFAARCRFRLGEIPYDFVVERTSIFIPDKTKLWTILDHQAFVRSTTREIERLRLKQSVILLGVGEGRELSPGKSDRLDVYERTIAAHEARLNVAVTNFEAKMRED